MMTNQYTPPPRDVVTTWEQMLGADIERTLLLERRARLLRTLPWIQWLTCMSALFLPVAAAYASRGWLAVAYITVAASVVTQVMIGRAATNIGKAAYRWDQLFIDYDMMWSAIMAKPIEKGELLALCKWVNQQQRKASEIANDHPVYFSDAERLKMQERIERHYKQEVERSERQTEATQ